MSELKSCPNIWCECNRVTVWKAKGGKNLRRVRYFAECDNCHQQGPAKRFRRSAVKAWNKPWKGKWFWESMPRRVGCDPAGEYTAINRPQDGAWRVGEGEKG